MDKPHTYWTVEEYDRLARSFQSGVHVIRDTSHVTEGNLFTLCDSSSDSEVDDVSNDEVEVIGNTRGLTSVCPLNSLDSFHRVFSFPPDVLHDLFEGLLSFLVNLIVFI